ncbi:unnamed protein product [Pylaiella littoralis]
MVGGLVEALQETRAAVFGAEGGAGVRLLSVKPLLTWVVLPATTTSNCSGKVMRPQGTSGGGGGCGGLCGVGGSLPSPQEHPFAVLQEIRDAPRSQSAGSAKHHTSSLQTGRIFSVAQGHGGSEYGKRSPVREVLLMI